MTEIVIKFKKTGKETFDIKQDVPRGSKVREVVTVLDLLSEQLKKLTGKYLADEEVGLDENEKFEISKELKIEDLPFTR